MCLHKIKFNLTKTKDGYVGVGYKNINNNVYFDVPTNKLKMDLGMCSRWSTKWTRAWANNIVETGLADDEQSYRLGYHIFLNINDAKNYTLPYINGSIPYIPVFVAKVSYRNIICFGTNQTGNGFGDTVVSEYMKFDKLVLATTNKKTYDLTSSANYNKFIDAVNTGEIVIERRM